MTTTNFDLERIAKREKIRLDYIVFKDQLNLVKYKPYLNSTFTYSNEVNIILNMSSTGHQGTHWIALAIRGNIAYYFDSFGVIMPIEVIEWCNNNNIYKLIYNDIEIQHTDEGFCGQYSLVFLSLLS